jgi:hypothetical protein
MSGGPKRRTYISVNIYRCLPVPSDRRILRFYNLRIARVLHFSLSYAANVMGSRRDGDG